MNEVEKGNFGIRFISKHKMKLAYWLIILLICPEIQELLKKLLQTQEEKRNAEIYALQLQINPHFVYNTPDIRSE